MVATDDVGRPTAARRARVVYDRLAPGYERVMRPLDRWYLSRLRSATLAQLPEGGRLLEVGAGTGLNFPLYPRTLGLSVASELSAAMIGIASAKQRPDNVQLVHHGREASRRCSAQAVHCPASALRWR